MDTVKGKGRFAPTPSGRLHLGNVAAAMLAYLSPKAKGGECVLRVEDLDNARCSFADNIKVMLDDLDWLGFKFDGGYNESEFQSNRFAIYSEQLDRLFAAGLCYPCYCSRSELHVSVAPHSSDGSYVYDGKCRNLTAPRVPTGKRPCIRLKVPDEVITLTDGLQGVYSENLAAKCGDFIVRRSDGVYAYQLAVVCDDGLSGITEVVRGVDLLSSTPRQIYLYKLLGLPVPRFYHIPLMLDGSGNRLSKRSGSGNMESIRKKFRSPEPIIGLLAYSLGLTATREEMTLDGLIPVFSWEKIKKDNVLLGGEELL